MSIEESVEYHRLIAQGLSEDLVYVATWIDRAYSCLVQNGMGGAEAYAQAVSSWAANSLDLEVTTPETAIAAILEQGYIRKGFRASTHSIRKPRFSCSGAQTTESRRNGITIKRWPQ